MVVTVTAAFSLLGYWRTLIERIACSPAMTMRRLTTIAMTGRRMKRSVNFIGWPQLALLVGRLRRHLGGRRQIVVHHHRHSVAQFERAAADHRLARGKPGDHGDEVAPAFAQADEFLPSHGTGLAVRPFRLLDGVHRVAEGGENHAGDRDYGERMLLVGEHLDVGEHPGSEATVEIVEGGPDA